MPSDAKDVAAAELLNLQQKVKKEDGNAIVKGNGGEGDENETAGRWSAEEDDQLRKAVSECGARNWKKIASEYLNGQRSDVQCLHRWQKVLKPGLVKGPWTDDEDNVIRECILEKNITRWSEVAKLIPGRIGKQCRERWFNHLDPTIKKEPWTPEEDRLLIFAQEKLGNRWSQIAKQYLKGRPENAVKNRWNAATRRRRQGQSTTPTGTARAAPGTASPAQKKRKATKSTRKSKKQKKAESNFGVNLDGMVSLASVCALALHGESNGASAAKPKRKKRTKVSQQDVKEAAKAATEFLTKAIGDPVSLSSSSSRRQRNSFIGSRPNLAQPPNIKTSKEDANGDIDAATPVWKSPKSASKSNGKTGMSALEFLSSVTSAVQN